MKKFFNILFIFLLSSIIGISIIKVFYFPARNNHIENRRAYKFNGFSLKKYINGEFQDNLKNVLSDQVIGAMLMKETKKNIEYKNIYLYRRMFAKELDNRYVRYRYLTTKKGEDGREQLKYDDLFLYNRDYIMYKPIDMNKYLEPMKERLIDINKLKNKHQKVKFYTYLVENDNLNEYEEQTKLPYYEKMRSLLDSDIKIGRFKSDSFKDYKENYFKTDHHWKMEGMYKSYIDLVSFLDLEDKPFPRGKKILLTDSFRGSKTLKLGTKNELVDDFYIYDFSFPERKIILEGKLVDNYSLLDSKDFNKIGVVSYGRIYGTDAAELIISGGKENGENILVIGNSYDNGLLDLLSTSFKNLYSIDMRYFESVFEKKFDIDKYIIENKIDKVLFIGNAYLYFQDSFKFYE